MSIREIQNYIDFDLKQVSKITNEETPHPYPPHKPKSLGNIPVFTWIFNGVDSSNEFDMEEDGIMCLGILEGDYLSAMTSTRTGGKSLIYPLYQLPKGTFHVFNVCRHLVNAKFNNDKKQALTGYYIMTCIAESIFKNKDFLDKLISSSDDFVNQALLEVIDEVYKNYETSVLTEVNSSLKPC